MPLDGFFLGCGERKRGERLRFEGACLAFLCARALEPSGELEFVSASSSEKRLRSKHLFDTSTLAISEMLFGTHSCRFFAVSGERRLDCAAFMHGEFEAMACIRECVCA